MKRAADAASSSYESSDEDFAARILEIPSIYAVSLWLHGTTDVFFPYLDTDGRVPSVMKPHPDYLSAIAAAARGKATVSPSHASSAV